MKEEKERKPRQSQRLGAEPPIAQRLFLIKTHED